MRSLRRGAQGSAARRDPAPSRLAYRLNRLALTPAVRRLVSTGLPLLGVALAGAVVIGDAGRREAMRDWSDELIETFQNRETFMVSGMQVGGASGPLAREIGALLGIRFPVSSFDLDLGEMQRTIAALDAVEAASLRVRPGGQLQIDVRERHPAIIWRSADGLELLDRRGHRVKTVEGREMRPDLPLMAGEGAGARTAEALELVATGALLSSRMRGLARIGDRRWDVILDRGQRILLPERNPVGALEQVIAMQQAQDLLGRDVVQVDMRMARRPTVRMQTGTAGELRKIKLSELGAD
ncbi:cell division protein FtsQ/DivIB [Profundibacterium mesophilum]|uniref:Cell division protein FtsQ n=1 Tax=Profundibacterium mesophilum KAUST100406-0324 TaxID=1037889 RepID=A0A921NUH1_9RHOB|nr:cell division protein FtsQ/DivIB [Profundibacterium mesophilum]KAF0675461.1 Cell division protein FtsQ [Profundibacterium mesophilum KAUST100406-0324]